MPKVDTPIVDAKVSSNDIGGSAKSIAFTVAGISLLYVLVQYGLSGGEWLQTQADSVIGTNTGSASIPTRGDL